MKFIFFSSLNSSQMRKRNSAFWHFHCIDSLNKLIALLLLRNCKYAFHVLRVLAREYNRRQAIKLFYTFWILYLHSIEWKENKKKIDDRVKSSNKRNTLNPKWQVQFVTYEQNLYLSFANQIKLPHSVQMNSVKATWFRRTFQVPRYKICGSFK